MSFFRKLVWILELVIITGLLAACSAKAINEEEKLEVANSEISKVQEAGLEQDLTVSENVKDEARDFLKKAFNCDVNDIEPLVSYEDEGSLIDLRFSACKDNENDFFIVDFRTGYDYPMTLYHFCHPNEEEPVHIENDKEFQFQEEMIVAAKDFVKSVYGADCSLAKIDAYGYAHKVSVQLDLGENEIFQVRFYYEEAEPVGILYFKDAGCAKEAMEANNATLLYSSQ